MLPGRLISRSGAAGFWVLGSFELFCLLRFSATTFKTWASDPSARAHAVRRPSCAPRDKRRYARGFTGRPWQDPGGVGSPPHPYPYAGTFSPYHHYPPMPRMGPGGGYGFPPPPFFSGFPPTAAGYPPHHVGAPSAFPQMFGSSTVPYGAAPAPGVAGSGGGAGGGAGADREMGRGRLESGGGDGHRCERKRETPTVLRIVVGIVGEYIPIWVFCLILFTSTP